MKRRRPAVFSPSADNRAAALLKKLGVRKNILGMTGYVPGEQPRRSGAIKLNANENPHPPSPRVIAAIRRALGGVRLYPESTSREVREIAARLYGISSCQVMVTNGSDEMLRILFQACVEPGEEVAAFAPSYTYYRTLADIQGARYREIPFTEDYRLPGALSLSRTRLVFLPNPNAPSGTLFDHKEIARLCCATRRGLVVIDEAYIDFAEPGASALPLLERFPNLVVTRTLSKSYALAGLRIGLGFASQAIMAQCEKVRDYYNVDRLAQAAAAAALADQAWLRRHVDCIRRTREQLSRALTALGAYVWPSAANFVLARFIAPPAAAIYARLKRRGILVRYFDTPRLRDCLRITVGTDRQIDSLLKALAKILSAAGRQKIPK